jgi:hypothetical protein
MHTLHTGKRAFLLIVLISVILQQNGYAQNYQPNFGLRQPQDPATLPVSKAPRPVTVRKAKVNLSAELQRVTDNEYLLNSGWEMAPADMVTAAENSIFNASFNTSGWFNATVPGTVLTTLVEQGVYPDPYFGLNNLYIPDSLCRKQWWYRLELPLPETIAGKNVWLVFNGINYKADIWLNGKLLGRMAGAFTIFDSSSFHRPLFYKVPCHPGSLLFRQQRTLLKHQMVHSKFVVSNLKW